MAARAAVKREYVSRLTGARLTSRVMIALRAARKPSIAARLRPVSIANRTPLTTTRASSCNTCCDGARILGYAGKCGTDSCLCPIGGRIVCHNHVDGKRLRERKSDGFHHHVPAVMRGKDHCRGRGRGAQQSVATKRKFCIDTIHVQTARNSSANRPMMAHSRQRSTLRSRPFRPNECARAGSSASRAIAAANA